IRPPIEEITKLLRDGIIPAVVYDGAFLRVRPATEGSYVAISHVWADGMGSTTEDGLPACVVKRIASLVQGLHPETGAFWMDSLCVPDSRDVRKRAIKLMTQTYRDAASVLVIDNCIRAQCSEKKPWDENLFGISTSGWTRRVWTLQEGLLNSRLYFEFQEGPVNIEDQGMTFIWCLSHLPFLSFRARYDVWKADATLDTFRWELISLLILRGTTKAEDETVAISGILSLNVDAFLAINGPDAAQERMKEFLIQLARVPRVLPVHTMPRLELPGFLWAPRSLTTVPPGAFRDDSGGQAFCAPFGLLGEYFI
ncbi:uncharacterized protein TRAVEDRAFT_87268, partial [Trametes versicolor FP-101664 SS1]|uniref:uncharacterized protein n=1 Tax=Trametes versicolor (strain FP-101664) TaxID=717944 RepID=UPI0004623B38